MKTNTKGSPEFPEAQAKGVATESKSDLRRRLRKGFRTLRVKGPTVFVRDAMYSFFYHRHKRRHGRGLPAMEGGPFARVWGQQFELHPSLKGINRELRLFGVHEPLATSVYQEFLRPDDHVVDVGANIGYYLLAAAQVVKETGRFLAFEPVPGNYAILERNVERFAPGRVQTWRWAIGATNETGVFYESEVPNWGSFIRSDNLAQTREIAVETRRLDDVLETVGEFRPTVLRMDVEGAELLVLAGAEKFLRVHRPLLFIEFHTFVLGMEAVMKTLSDLASLGYREGVLIDRRWDQPWISPWARMRRCWRGSLQQLSQRLHAQASEFPVFTLIVQRP